MENMCLISGSCFVVIITEALLYSTLPCKLIFVFVLIILMLRIPSKSNPYDQNKTNIILNKIYISELIFT